MNLKLSVWIGFIAMSFLTISLSGYAATQTGKTVTVAHHKSTHVVLSGKAKQVSLGDPEVLDIVILKSNEVFLIGKKLGSTNLMAWDSRGKLIETFTIEVAHERQLLQGGRPNNSRDGLVEKGPERQLLQGGRPHHSQDGPGQTISE